MRDAAEDFGYLDTKVYGISLDDVSDLADFAKAQKLNFQLLSDPDGSATKKFGAMMDKRAFANRFTYVIDDKGILRHIDRKVDVSSHGTDLVELVAGLREGK